MLQQSSMENDVNDSLPVIAMDLSDIVLHHTWSIRCLSAFVVPLDTQGDFAALEESMSLFLRNHHHIHNRQQQQQQQQQQITQDDADDGTFVQMYWCQCLNASLMEQNSEKITDQQERQLLGKRRRLGDPSDNISDTNYANDDTEHNSTRTTSSNSEQWHLLIDIKIQEEQSAQIVGCFPQFTKNNDNDNGNPTRQIQKFDFLLTRGSKSATEAALGWFETFTGCAIAKQSFRPTVAHVAQAMTLWTSEHLRQQQQQQMLNDNDDWNSQPASHEKKKSLWRGESCHPIK